MSAVTLMIMSPYLSSSVVIYLGQFLREGLCLQEFPSLVVVGKLVSGTKFDIEVTYFHNFCM